MCSSPQNESMSPVGVRIEPIHYTDAFVIEDPAVDGQHQCRIGMPGPFYRSSRRGQRPAPQRDARVAKVMYPQAFEPGRNGCRAPHPGSEVRLDERRPACCRPHRLVRFDTSCVDVSCRFIHHKPRHGHGPHPASDFGGPNSGVPSRPIVRVSTTSIVDASGSTCPARSAANSP